MFSCCTVQPVALMFSGAAVMEHYTSLCIDTVIVLLIDYIGRKYSRCAVVMW